MKFIADEMLGRLAKWMRIIGFDTLYFKSISDYELLAKAAQEGRIILTRDTHLGEKTISGNLVLIKTDKYLEQLKEVQKLLKLKISKQNVFMRCLTCNIPIHPLAKGEVKDKVPPYVFEVQEVFNSCPSCQKIYWGGTHYTNTLDSLKKKLKLSP